MKYTDTFREGIYIVDVYLCRNKQVALTKSDKEYGNLVLQGKTGITDAKIQDLDSSDVGGFETMDYVHVEIGVTLLQSSNRMNIRRIRKAQEGEYVEAGYLPILKKNIQEMYEELLGYIRSMRNQHLQKLLSIYFVGGPASAKALQLHSAAKDVHHGFVGGLLKHTLSVIELCDYYASYYLQFNRDLLLTAAIFHDIDKTKGSSHFPENDHTNDGQLLGHTITGTEMVSRGIRAIPGFPEVLTLELKHCILAHHGELEYGSPKKPALLETLTLNFADNTGAKMETMIEASNAGNAGNDNKGQLGYSGLLETSVKKTSE